MVDWIGERLYNKYGSKSVEIWDEYMREFGLGVSTESGLPKEHKGIIEYTNIEQAGSYLAPWHTLHSDSPVNIRRSNWRSMPARLPIGENAFGRSLRARLWIRTAI